jgi:HAD superfamily phosphatase
MIVGFDVDGVLIEVGESYHRALAETVAYFLQSQAEVETLLKLKVTLNLNNDWDAALAGILFYRTGFTFEEFNALSSSEPPDFRKLYRLAEKTKVELPVYEEVIEYFETRYRRHRFRETLKIPAEILRDIRNLARVMAVITGRIKYDLDHTFKKYSLYQYFDFILTEDDLASIDCRKPSSYSLRQLFRKFEYSFPACYVGDTLADRQMVDNYCREEGKRIVFILYQHKLNQQVEADFYVNNPEELLRVLKEIKG